MSDIQFVSRHGYLLLFIWLLAEQAALPIPSFPLLLVSGALARTGHLKLSSVIFYALAACLIADNAWFQLGRRYSSKAVRFICKMSLEPDSCVRRMENIFITYGLRSLASVEIHSGIKCGRRASGRWLWRELRPLPSVRQLCALIWIVSYVFAGFVFSSQLELAVSYATRIGSGFVIITTCMFTTWIAWKLLQRRRFVKSVNVERISAEELHAKLSAGLDITIVDVRSNLARNVDLSQGHSEFRLKICRRAMKKFRAIEKSSYSALDRTKPPVPVRR